MQNLNFSVMSNWTVRRWPRVESYQNSTLVYPPPKDFPAYWSKQNFRPRLLRTWVTLSDIWDIETDTYNWNFRRTMYDPTTPDSAAESGVRPFDILFEDYLTSFCAIADEVMLNVRRFEAEVAWGILPLKKYEEVCEKVIEHCRDLCENIVYIEVSNEQEFLGNGKLTMNDYMPLYDAVCRAVTRINARRGWKLKVGGPAMGNNWTLHGVWHDYLKLLAEDTCPEKRIDFYSYHSYNPDNNCLQQTYNAHKAGIAEFNLPDVPLFITECGVCRPTGVLTDSLKNAAGMLTTLMRAADLQGLYVLPWCTFHNPELQMSYTQYLFLPEGGYAATPNGHAIHLLHDMLENEVLIRGDVNLRARATRKDDKLYLIVTNPSEDHLAINCTLEQLEGQTACVEIRQVDDKRNNAVTNPPCTSLQVTETRCVDIVEGTAAISCELPPFGFASWSVTVK